MKIITFILVTLSALNSQALLGGEPVYYNEPISRSIVRISNPSNRKTFCSGVLISPNVILTAAHCEKPSVDSYFINIDPYTSSGSGYSVKKFIKHPNYNRDDFKSSDLALIILDTNVYNPQPISLHRNEFSNFQDTSGEIFLFGFGVHIDKDKNIAPSTLRTATKERFSFEDGNLILDQNDNIGLCYGDSGGPVMLKTSSEKFVIIAINRSVGTKKNAGINDPKNCSTESHSTLIYPYLEWIKKEIKSY